MTDKADGDTRTLWEHIWYPTEDDVLYCRVFAYISTPFSLLVSSFVLMFSLSQLWLFLLMFWMIGALVIRMIASLRYSQIKELNKPENPG